VLAASVLISFANSSMSDYPGDAQPAIVGLAHGSFSAFLRGEYVMGPLSLLVRAPFAALAHGDPLGLAPYQWGCVPCLFAAGLLGLYLARIARRRGAGVAAQIALVGVCLFNPLTFAALQWGHPEEVLTTALVVGAVAVASQGHSWRAAVLLGLAVACKQWALLALLPVLMALPSRRIAVALAAGAVAGVLIAPGLIADPHSFFAAQQNVASTTRFVDPWNLWYPVAGATPGKAVFSHGHLQVAPYHGGSALIGHYAHWLIVLVAIGLPLLLAARRRSFSLSGADAMALLALLMLLRCALDPVDNLYYQEPFLVALAGWDALSSRGLPLRALAAALIGTALSRWSFLDLSDPQVINTLYLAAVIPALAGIAYVLARGPAQRRAPSWRIAAPRPARAG
jgi:hypothetical protein